MMMMMKVKIVPKSTEGTSLLVSLLLEGVSATLDQLGFALPGMIMAYIALFLSVVDLILKAQQKRLIWVVGSSLLPCFRRNFSSKGKRFDSLVAYFGVACAAWQCLYSTTGYVYAHQNLGNPIRMCLLPFVFVSCVGITQFIRSTVPSDKKSQATEAQTAEEAETEVVRQRTPQLQHSFHFPPDRKRFNKKQQAVISVGEESSNNALKIGVGVSGVECAFLGEQDKWQIEAIGNEFVFNFQNEKMSRLGDWNCRSCQHLNFQRRDSCQRCHDPRSGGGADFGGFGGRGGGGSSFGFTTGSDFRPGNWYCAAGNCGAHNFAIRSSCFKCGVYKDDAGGGAFVDSDISRARGFGSSGGGSGNRSGWKSGDWICTRWGCNEHNFDSRMECFKCNAPRELSSRTSY